MLPATRTSRPRVKEKNGSTRGPYTLLLKNGGREVRHRHTTPFRNFPSPEGCYPERALTFQFLSSRQKNSISVGKRCSNLCQGKSALDHIFLLSTRTCRLISADIICRRRLYRLLFGDFCSLGCCSMNGGWQIVIKNGRGKSFIRFTCSTEANASRYNSLSPTGDFFPADSTRKPHTGLAIHET
jgi:hypothetical protein